MCFHLRVFFKKMSWFEDFEPRVICISLSPALFHVHTHHV